MSHNRASANAHDCTNSNQYRPPADVPCGRCTSRRSATAPTAVTIINTPMPPPRRASANDHHCTCRSYHRKHSLMTSRRSATAPRAVAKTTTPMPHPSRVSADDQPLHQQQQPSSTTPTPPPRRAPADDWAAVNANSPNEGPIVRASADPFAAAWQEGR